MYDVGGRQLYIDCAGAGSPTFVIEPGEGQISGEMADLKSKLAEKALVCSYDRANHGQSGPAPTPRTVMEIGTDQIAGLLIMNPVPPCGPWLEQGLVHMTEAERVDERAYYAGANDEPVDYCTSSQQIDDAPAPTSMPIEMLISTIAQCESRTDICGRTYAAYENVMRELTDQWPGGHFSQVESIHSIYVGKLDVVLETIDRLTARIAQQASG